MENRLSRRSTGIVAAAVLVGATTSWAGAATPDMAVAARAGTTGIGVDFDIALAGSVSARIGYSGFDYDHGVDTADVQYRGNLKLSMATGLIDWYAFHGGFHVSAGAVGGDTRLDITGHPSAGGSYSLNGHSYTAAELGSLTGQMKFGNSVSPYVGIGWGDPVGVQRHLHFLVDIGAIYGGTPAVVLDAACGSAAGSAACTQLHGDVTAEKAKLRHDVSIAQWYPVLDVGLAYRF